MSDLASRLQVGTEKFEDVLGAIGRNLLMRLSKLHRLALLIYVALRSIFIGRKQSGRTITGVVASQVYFTGWEALPLMMILAIATGVVVVIQSSAQLSFLGGTPGNADILVAILFRELGPLLTALIVIARSGIAVATEVGNMKVNDEIDALRVMGIDPMSFVVFPRLVGGVIAVTTLSIYYVFSSFIGGYLALRMKGPIAIEAFVHSILVSLTPMDLGLFLMKNMFNGLMIFGIASQEGFSVGRSPHEVPQATTRAVMRIVIYVVGLNLLVTVLTYLQKIKDLGVSL